MRMPRRMSLPVLVVLALLAWYVNQQDGDVHQAPATDSGLVEQAYADGLIDTFHIRLESVRDRLA